MSQATKKSITITMDEGLLARVDKVAEESYQSRSGLITICVSAYIKFVEMLLDPNALLNPEVMELVRLQHEKLQEIAED